MAATLLSHLQVLNFGNLINILREHLDEDVLQNQLNNIMKTHPQNVRGQLVLFAYEQHLLAEGDWNNMTTDMLERQAQIQGLIPSGATGVHSDWRLRFMLENERRANQAEGQILFNSDDATYNNTHDNATNDRQDMTEGSNEDLPRNSHHDEGYVSEPLQSDGSMSDAGSDEEIESDEDTEDHDDKVIYVQNMGVRMIF